MTKLIMWDAPSDPENWIFIGFCPMCSASALYQHKHWTDGSAGEHPYAHCSSCHQGYILAVLEEDFYGDLIEEKNTARIIWTDEPKFRECPNDPSMIWVLEPGGYVLKDKAAVKT